MFDKDFQKRLDPNHPADPKYKEILKLHRMLQAANIPHTISRNYDGWIVCYPVARPLPHCVCDAIEFSGSYGSGQDLLEIMGLHDMKKDDDDLGVVGWLSAQEVFDRIEAHWKKNYNHLKCVMKKLQEEEK